MSKSYHSKKEYKRRVKVVREFRERVAAVHGSMLATLNVGVDKDALSRHPGGTRGKGLKRVYRERWKVSDYRDRFGEVEEQSYRLRRLRRAVKHSARKKLKKEVYVFLQSS